MKKLIEQIKLKADSIPTNTEINRRVKGAYVDCLIMAKEASKNLVLADVMLACPFCGDNNLHISEKYSNDKTVTWYKIHHIATVSCSVSMIDSDKQNLIERWNKRA